MILFKAILNDDRNEMTCEILIAWTNDFIFTHNENLINTWIIQTSAFKASEHVNFVD